MTESVKFLTKAIPQGQKTHLIISWNDSETFNADQLDKETINCLTLMIDVSSSMNCILGKPNQTFNQSTDFSRLSIVKEALSESLDVLQKLVLDGVKISLTMILFSDQVQVVYPPDLSNYNHILQDNDFSNLREVINKLHACGATSIDRAIRKSQEVSQVQEKFFQENGNPRRRYFKIMCSDGDDTCDYRSNQSGLIETYSETVDITIGVGSACDYTQSVLVGLAKDGDFLSAPDKKTFVEGFVSKVFSATTLVATNVELGLNPDLEVETTLEHDQESLKIGSFQSFRYLIVTFKSHKWDQIDLPLKFHLEKENQDQIQMIRIDFEEDHQSHDNPLANLLSLFQTSSVELKEIAEDSFQNPEYISLSEEDRIVWLRKYLDQKKTDLQKGIEEVKSDPEALLIIPIVQNTIMELDKLQKANRSEEYLACLYSSSRMTSNGIYSSDSYCISKTYSSRPNVEPDLVCKVCLQRDRRVVAFPCRHMVCCVGCASTMETHGMSCPVCRGSITTYHEVMMPSLKDDPLMICLKCQKNRIQSFNLPCQHATFCDSCRKSKDLTCPIETCQKSVRKSHHFLRS